MRSLSQHDIIINYNKLAQALTKQGITKLTQQSNYGLCGGLTLNFLHSVKGKRLEEFYRYLDLMVGLTDDAINQIISNYTFYFDGHLIQRDDLLQFLKVISDAQKGQIFKLLGVHWDRSFLVFCSQNELADLLRNAKIKKGDFIFTTFSVHAFGIVKLAGEESGFYVFEPENLSKKGILLKSEDEVAEVILRNAGPVLTNENIALNLCFLTYGDKNREIDDFIFTFEELIKERKQIFKTENELITQYNNGKLARIELGRALYYSLSERLDLSDELIGFNKMLGEYLKENLIDDSIFLKDVSNKFAYKQNITALYIASHYNNISAVQNLLVQGADPNARIKDSNLNFPLYIASFRGNTTCVNLLLKHPEINPNLLISNGETALFTASFEGNIGCVSELLTHTEIEPNQPNNIDETPLYAAVKNRHIDCVIALLSHPKTDPNKARKDGENPLHVAVMRGTDFVRALLSNAKTDPNQMRKDGTTALYWAAKKGYLDSAQVLLEHGAKWNMTIDASYKMLLTEAEKKGRKSEVAKLFNLKSFYFFWEKAPETLLGFNPLHAAAFYGHADVLKLLLDHGADINIKAAGFTALDLSKAMGNKEIILILQERQLQQSTILKHQK